MKRKKTVGGASEKRRQRQKIVKNEEIRRKRKLMKWGGEGEAGEGYHGTLRTEWRTWGEAWRKEKCLRKEKLVKGMKRRGEGRAVGREEGGRNRGDGERRER